MELKRFITLKRSFKRCPPLPTCQGSALDRHYCGHCTVVHFNSCIPELASIFSIHKNYQTFFIAVLCSYSVLLRRQTYTGQSCMYKNCSVGLQVRVYKCYIDLPGNVPADDNLRWKYHRDNERCTRWRTGPSLSQDILYSILSLLMSGDRDCVLLLKRWCQLWLEVSLLPSVSRNLDVCSNQGTWQYCFKWKEWALPLCEKW